MNRRIGLVLTAAAVFVLVFALAGTSYAASQGHKAHASATKKHKKPKPKRGPAGPAGPAGKEGLAGKDGKEGPAGKDGKEGKEGKEGIQGPSGIVTMENFFPSGAVNTSSTLKFLGTPIAADFDAKTAAQLTATVDYASSDGTEILANFGICDQPVGGSSLDEVSSVFPQFAATAHSFFAQTVSGVISGLTPGEYEIGACTANETAKVQHGASAGTAIMAETR